MSEESKTPDSTEAPSGDEAKQGPVDNVVDEILETVGGMNAMFEALDKSRPHLQEAGKVFLSALAKATEEARSTAEASAGAAEDPENPATKRGAEIAAKLFGAIDKVAQAAAPGEDKDPQAAEFEDAAATTPSELGARLVDALDHALGVAVEKLEGQGKAGDAAGKDAASDEDVAAPEEAAADEDVVSDGDDGAASDAGADADSATAETTSDEAPQSDS